jgi:PAS domain S-box-containing protein
MSYDDIKKIDPNIEEYILDQLGAIVIADHEGRYVHVNDQWCELMNLTLEDVKGRYVREIVPNTKVDECIRKKEVIIGSAIKGIANNDDLFTSYIPIIRDGEVIAVFLHVIIKSITKALYFSNTVNKMANQLAYYKEELRKLHGAKYNIDNIIGNSPQTQALKEQIIKASRTHSCVLIEGETGTGKELVAHAIHDLSQRNLHPLVKVNCAAIPDQLMESEFFGYEDGAFTGAKKGGKSGKFELANHGSLFLDEINQLPMDLQPKLLRVFQENEIERVGGNASIPIDVRIIVASNIELEKMIKEKKFRSDLYYRINVIKISVPPLRERLEDIPLIASNIVKKLNFTLSMNITRISDDVMNQLKHYHWPGNIRELHNVIERAMNMTRGTELHWIHFKDYFENKTLNPNQKILLDDISKYHKKQNLLEKDLILFALEKSQGNKTKAAEILGISRTTLYTKMKQCEIQ